MEIQESIKNFQDTRKQNIARGFVTERNVEAEPAIEKAEEVEENPFEEIIKAEEREIEKSDVYEAIAGHNGESIKISKTGAEIKEHIKTVLLPAMNSELENCEHKADDLLEETGDAPKKEVDRWWTREMRIAVPYRIYDWDETYFNKDNKAGMIADSLSAEHSAEKKSNLKNYPATEEQAAARQKYNEAVRNICNVLIDIKACEVLEKIDDEKTFELTPQQIWALRF